MSAEVWCVFQLNDVGDPLSVTGVMFDTFSEELIRPKSLQITLPGHATAFKFQPSVDGTLLCAGPPADRPLFEGESPCQARL